MPGNDLIENSTISEHEKIPTIEDIDPETGKFYTKSQIKKIRKNIEFQRKKAEKTSARLIKEKEEAEKKLESERLRLEKSKTLKIIEDTSLPVAEKITIEQASDYINKRVKIFGWVDTLRDQGKVMFIVLRDGTGFPGLLQVLLDFPLIQHYEALTLHREASVCIYGTLHSDERAPSGIEMHADYWYLLGASSGEYSNLVKKDSNVSILMDQRHLMIREQQNRCILHLRSTITHCFREYFFDTKYVEITPPTIVQTQVEGGSTLFSLDYYGEPAFLTQSSQLYLETCVYSFKRVFCLISSYRAEKTRTRRHLAEYSHLEAEISFIEFNDLLDSIEDLVCQVSQRIVDKCGDMLFEVNPDFKPITKPIKRMDHSDAIKFCNENYIYKDEETKEMFEYGDDIPEGPERKMTDMINEPILLCRFPAKLKPFYMSRCKENEDLTESVDLLLPSVGEVVGGSMREYNYDRLMAGFQKHGIDSEKYYWYSDLRKYGTMPHGGYGLGLERFICWVLKQDHIRNVCLYPRFMNRCSP